MDLTFILVEPAVPENIGASARALKTMGFDQLRLVNTRQHQHKQAQILAHGSGDILEAAGSFDSLEEALADIDLAIATSAKTRHRWRDLLTPAQVRELIANKVEADVSALGRVALVFGCEESGLSRAQLQICDIVSGIPLAVSFPSLNLSQAVMLYAYELSQLRLGPKQRDRAMDDNHAAQWRALKNKLQQMLPMLSYEPDSTLYRWAMEKLGRLGAKDVGFMHTLCDKVLQLTDKRSSD